MRVDLLDLAYKQPVSLPKGRAVADSGCGHPPDAQVRVAPSKRPREENREVASVHFARHKSDCLKVTDTVRTHVGRFYATFKCVRTSNNGS